MTRKYFTALFLLSVLAFSGVALSACGIKPKNLQAPSGEAAPDFPAVYPAPSSDE